MNLYIFDKKLNMLGNIDKYESFIWKRKSSEAGEFELYCDLNEDTTYLLKEGNVICKSDDLSECAYIKNIYTDDDNEEKIKVTGSFILGYTSQRIIWNTENITDTVENAIYRLIDINCINTEEKRKIPLLKLSEKKGYEENISFQVSYRNLLEKIESLCLENDLNIKVVTDLINKTHTIELYKSTDKTIDCIFSKDFENVLKQSYILETSGYKNTALVGGEGEGEKRKFTTIGDENKGFDRYELFVDADSIRSESEDITITEDEYIKQLTQKGLEQLSQYKKVETFSSDVNVTNSNLVYKKDYDLGDIVTCINKKWDIISKAKITEIEEIYENNCLEVNITFGNKIPTIVDKIRQVIK